MFSGKTEVREVSHHEEREGKGARKREKGVDTQKRGKRGVKEINGEAAEREKLGAWRNHKLYGIIYMEIG